MSTLTSLLLLLPTASAPAPGIHAQPVVSQAGPATLTRVPAQEARRGYIGIELSDEGGLTITRVREGLPGEKAGLRAGDRVLVAGDRRIETYDDLLEVLGARGPGAALPLRVLRDGKELELSVTLGTPPGEAPDEPETDPERPRRAPRAERPDPPERPDRPDASDRPERSQRPRGQDLEDALRRALERLEGESRGFGESLQGRLGELRQDFDRHWRGMEEGLQELRQGLERGMQSGELALPGDAVHELMEHLGQEARRWHEEHAEELERAHRRAREVWREEQRHWQELRRGLMDQARRQRDEHLARRREEEARRRQDEERNLQGERVERGRPEGSSDPRTDALRGGLDELRRELEALRAELRSLRGSIDSDD